MDDEFGVATFWVSLNIPIRSLEEFCLLYIIDVVAHISASPILAIYVLRRNGLSDLWVCAVSS